MSAAAASTALSSRLRQATWAQHQRAERTGFIQGLFAGRLDRAAYALMLRNLHPIYRALEQGLLAHVRHPAVAPILDTALFRCDALGHDLLALHGTDWEQGLALVPSAQAYAERLDALARGEPALLAAHAYVRYLGDLNGGQLFARLLPRLAAPPGSPVAQASRFHDFGAPADVVRKAGALRRGLDALGAGEDLAQRIVAEAVQAFERHVVLFDELALAGSADLRAAC